LSISGNLHECTSGCATRAVHLLEHIRVGLGESSRRGD
jgi:hypothetical protein